MQPSLHQRHEGNEYLPYLLWRFDEHRLVISSGPLGGGIGPRRWVLNATVNHGYARMDPDRHLGELAALHAVTGPGVGLLTAVDVRHRKVVVDGGAEVWATTGIHQPQWAAVPAGDPSLADPDRVGTINVVAFVPVRLSDAALVNAVATVTEAKAQAFADLGLAGTGTPTDAVCVVGSMDGPAEPFGGPRSTWGARLARATHRAVRDGAIAQARWRSQHPVGSEAPIPAPGPPLHLPALQADADPADPDGER